MAKNIKTSQILRRLILIQNINNIKEYNFIKYIIIIFHVDIKKTSQELYGLINYGELRRKLPRIHEKVYLRLNELVYWGSMQVRLRGKTMRIKTPICRALRKLNQLEGIYQTFLIYTKSKQ